MQSREEEEEGPHNVDGEGLPAGVPERVHEDLVVLDSHGAHRGVKVKGTLLEHDRVLVVNARALGEHEQRRGVILLDVLLHSLCHNLPVFNLHYTFPLQSCHDSLCVESNTSYTYKGCILTCIHNWDDNAASKGCRRRGSGEQSCTPTDEYPE